MAELASLFWGLGFALEGFEVNSFVFAVEREDEEEPVEGDLFLPAVCVDEEGFPPLEEEDEEDFILASSASKAGARVLTTASRSDCFDRDWTARGTKTMSVRVLFWSPL